MVFPMALMKIGAHWLLSCYLAARKLRSHGSITRANSFRSSHHQASTLSCPPVTKCPLEGRDSQSLVCDISGSLLRSPSFFPYFMLVAFEGGSLLRSLVLLLSYPLLLALGGHHHELSLKIMVFITFCGLRKVKMETVAKAVLPKFYLEGLNLHCYEVMASVKGRKVVVTSMPRAMVEGFLKEYLSVDEVLGAELQVLGGWFTGLFTSGGFGLAEKHKALRDLFGERQADVGLIGSSNPHHQLFFSHCKEAYVVTKETSAAVPRGRYPKPLIFHDGRLAFLPTPSAALFFFLYLPFGLALAIIRILIGTLLPYNLAFILSPLTGFCLRVQGPTPTANANSKGKGVLYVCNHRTLLDPVVLSAALGRPMTAVTYSLSPVSELLSPIRTARLTRDRNQDAARIQRLLSEGDLVVCPEGTTCREPYLLRFSSLFAELSDEMEPVAVDTEVSMFYGTSTGALKWLDPVFFLMNPRPEYVVRFLGRVPEELTCGGGGLRGSEVANRIQRQLGEVLGFECTGLTRKDKYLMLAGNEGVVVR